MIELCQNAPAPKIVLFQEVAGTGARKFGPAEKSPQVIGHFDCARREHGFTMASASCRGNPDLRTFAGVLH
jgi:hypothetical protein